MTRRILSEEGPGSLPKGVTRADVVTAYPSEAALKADYFLTCEGGNIAQLGLFIGQRLAIPTDQNPEKALAKTIDLVPASGFRQRRRELYKWQRDVFRDEYTPDSAIEELERLVKLYNEAVRDATGKVYWKLAFVLGGTALTLAAAPGSLVAGTAAILGVVGFAALERKPIVQAGEAGPAGYVS